MEKEKRNCDNCGFSRLNPCPHLMSVSCNPPEYMKWVEKKEIKLTGPLPEDESERELREVIVLRKKAEQPVFNFKLTVFFFSVIFFFIMIFLFKALRFVNHMLFGSIVLVMLVIFIWQWWSKSRKKRQWNEETND
jgi:Flp pilus assembly protein TadB